MLRVTIELVPFGIETQRRDLYEIKIGNIGGPDEYTDYDVTLTECATGVRRHTRVKDFDRKRGAVALTEEALKKLGRLNVRQEAA